MSMLFCVACCVVLGTAQKYDYRICVYFYVLHTVQNSHSYHSPRPTKLKRLQTTKPIIMIGPGTGIVPMRALLQERDYQKNTLSLPVGSNTLYFVCKKRSLDYLYSSELEEYQTTGALDDLYLAFSREQDKKVYVQHLLKKNGKKTWDLIDGGGAYVYVCGGVRMGSDVGEALRGIVSDDGGRSGEEAKEYMDGMAGGGRYVQELWA